MAREVARGRLTSGFAREHAAALRVQSSNLADALSRRDTQPEIEGRVRAKAREAARVAESLQRLHDHPSDRMVAGAVTRALRQLGGCK